MRLGWALAASVLLAGCASRRMAAVDAQRDRLFPYGVYRHLVTVSISRGASSEEHTFMGVVELRAEGNRVVGLSPFGTTLFRVTDAKTGADAVRTEIYLDSMKAFEARLREIYALMKTVLELSKRDEAGDGAAKVVRRDSHGLPAEIETVVDGRGVRIKIDDYAADALPLHFSVSHPKFNVDVKVSSYAP